jgi:superfamily II DNA or RNA helicase
MDVQNDESTIIPVIQTPWEELALDIMSKLLGHRVGFKSAGQKMAMEAVWKSRNDLLLALATNNGKSMVAIASAVAQPDRYTIIVIPYKALLTDWARKLTEMKVGYEIYTGQPFQGGDSIILTTPDMASMAGWTQHYGRLLQSRGVSRVFFDEAHVCISAMDYRPSMLNLSRFRKDREQFVLLTATAPPLARTVMMDNFLMSNPIVIAECTVRPEIEYVRHPERSVQNIKSTTTQLVKNAIAKMEGSGDVKGRILIYVPWRSLARELATQLDCEAYIGFDSKEDQWEGLALQAAREKDTNIKEKTLQQFRTGQDRHSRVLVATSALAAGYDYPHIRQVFSLVQPDGLLDLIQELHRVARDGVPGVAHIMPASGRGNVYAKPSDPQDLQGVVASHELIFGAQRNQCIRKAFTTFCDGVGLDCSSVPGARRCSVCKEKNCRGAFLDSHLGWRLMLVTDRSSEPIQRTTLSQTLAQLEAMVPATNFDVARKLAEQRQAHLLTTASDKEQRLRQALDRYKEVCVVCQQKGANAYPKHVITQCPTLKNSGGLEAYYRLSKLRYKASADGRPLRICFFCHVPQYSDILHPFSSKKQSRSDCEHYDIIMPACFLTLSLPSLQSKAQEYFGKEWIDEDQLREWLEDRRPGQLREGCSTNGEAMFLWYHEHADV